jgi:hypothetical protein
LVIFLSISLFIHYRVWVSAADFLFSSNAVLLQVSEGLFQCVGQHEDH